MAMDLTTIGEILIDLTQTGRNAQKVGQFSANPGGAPANVAVAAARLGARSAFIGCVGADAFGESLRATLEENGVDTRGMRVTGQAPTTLAVVTLSPSGERSFAFYRSPGADLCLSQEDLPWDLLEETAILHFGSVSLTADPARTATLAAVRRAKAQGALVTYDPNYRAPLWPSREEAVRQMRAPLGLVDVLKISDEELELLSGERTPEAAARVLQAQGIRLVLITLGPEGVYYRLGEATGRVPGCRVQAADTNGAGDTFFGAVLRCLGQRRGTLEGLTARELEPILRFANQAAALTTSRSGAIPAMPTLEEVEHHLEQD